MAKELDNTADILDVRDLIERFEELEKEAEALDGRDLRIFNESEDGVWMTSVAEFLGLLEGNGGDHDWRGYWYPVTLIRDSYFPTYAQEFAEDVGAINPDATWPNNCIDWERATCELRVDYSSAEFDGVTFWFR